jgi:peptidyl-prolyl cis-trans isomerase D
MRRSVVALALGLALGPIAACGDEPAPTRERTQGDAQVGGAVVATVDGHPITVADVEAQIRAEGGTPEEALAELERQTLLALEAERLGFGERSDVRRETRRATVQALLATIEREHPPSAIDEATLRRAYDEAVSAEPGQPPTSERFVVPEKRRSEHVLVRVEDASREREARRVASALLAELERDPGALETTLASLRGQTEREGFPLLVEEVPFVARDGSLEAGFEEVLFAGDAPGLRSELARTSFGWHVVIVREIQPRVERTFEEVAPELREEATNQRRFQALIALLDRLRAEAGVELVPSGVEAALRVEIAE